MKNLAITFFTIFILCTIDVFGQITISPTNIFIDSSTRFGTYIVINSSDESQEVSISFEFGYSKVNEDGTRTIVSNDSAMAEKHSITEYVRAFPQNFTLNPGDRQVVRLRINAPAELEDGTYWSRVKTVSNPLSTDVELDADSDNVNARVSLTVEQITGLYYKNGNVSTGLEIKNIENVISDSDQLETYISFERLGNSPFLGSITTSLFDADNELVAENLISTTLFFDGTYRQLTDITGLSAGQYKLVTEFDTRRSDVSSDDLVQMEPVRKTTMVTIP